MCIIKLTSTRKKKVVLSWLPHKKQEHTTTKEVIFEEQKECKATP